MPALHVRRLGRADYEPTWCAMQRFTDLRGPETPDECWCLEHPPVFTLGLNGDPAHVLAAGDTPVIATDRGGQVTWHGPGQLVMYVLIDLQRAGIGPRALVTALEQAVIGWLGELGIVAVARPKAPGVYVDGRKIAALGLRVRRGGSYHGLALNVAPDLEPFTRINPCGYRDLAVTSLRELGIDSDLAAAANGVLARLAGELGYTRLTETTAPWSPPDDSSRPA
ncbi:MAG: lipoyl(octanoyl) transferase LipB [Chromatiales bacterium]|jgi:lipoyl(octanoyl) transferase|nr:lipoyl(octanoyl) transferase LipB [Chromatiales bacterium]MDX9767984.1 lipoyl(octanoyl) transferase LipB [Ectothiorhodospiraceae bacterium]